MSHIVLVKNIFSTSCILLFFLFLMACGKDNHDSGIRIEKISIEEQKTIEVGKKSDLKVTIVPMIFPLFPVYDEEQI